MSDAELKNICFKPGMELKVTGVPKPNAARFAINVCDSEKNFALHFNPRFNCGTDQRVIVLNTCKDGCWQAEVRERNFPFQQGKEFEVTIIFADDKFYINPHDGQVLQFPNRLAGKQYDHISIDGEVTINGIYVK